MGERVIQVVSLRALSDAQLARLRAISPRLAISQRAGATRAELTAALTPEVEVAFAPHANFDLTHAAGLRWVQFENAGIDHVIDTPLWRSAVQLTSASGAHIQSMPEYVFAAILSFTHHMRALFELQRQARWLGWGERGFLTPGELRGQTIGIVGYGAIGREIARLAQAFGMRVVATRRPDRPLAYDGWAPPGTGDPDGSIPAAYYTLDQIGALLAESDIVVLVLPISPASAGLIGAAELAAMRPGSLLVNIGRGGLVDHAALEAALRAGQIGGALLDVTDPEPLPPESGLWGLQNVLITPHIGGLSRHYIDRVVDIFAENLRRYLAGEPLLNVVQRELGY